MTVELSMVFEILLLHRCGVQLVEQRMCERIGWGLFVGHAAKVGGIRLTGRSEEICLSYLDTGTDSPCRLTDDQFRAQL